jgi:ABC-type spermidine/putrescine transport system permease subunit I
MLAIVLSVLLFTPFLTSIVVYFFSFLNLLDRIKVLGQLIIKMCYNNANEPLC